MVLPAMSIPPVTGAGAHGTGTMDIMDITAGN